MPPKKTKEEIFAGFKEVHRDRYDYSQVKYTNTDTKVIIICKIHGEFQQTAAKHLSGQGCPTCGGNLRYDISKIISKFKDIIIGNKLHLTVDSYQLIVIISINMLFN